MSNIGGDIYEVGLCPSPGKRKGKNWRTPVAQSESYDEATNRLTVTVYLLRQGRTAPDRIYDIFLCPAWETCGCAYGTALYWEILSNCEANLYWQWPESAG